MSDKNWLIYETIGKLTPAAPKIVTYHNGTLVAFRNGDGDRVATLLEHTLGTDEIVQRINTLFKVKSENLPSQETLERLRRA